MAKISQNLQSAIESLIINDVYLKSTQALCEEGFDPKSTESVEMLLVQQMHVVTKSEVIQIEGDGQLVRVYILLGARWVVPHDEEDLEAESTPEIKAFIEGEFIAEYQMKTPLSQEAIYEFALKNASFHVWPYWREFLSSQCERLRLPRVMLPTVQFSKQPDSKAE